MNFWKYQALGNDYVVLEGDLPDADLVRRVCDRHFGLGADGVLWGAPAQAGSFDLRIFNPDGGEAEKSGNGLRIFARHLWDTGQVGAGAFPVRTPGGVVQCEVLDEGREVFVEMGRACFASREIPVAGPAREVVAEPFRVAGKDLCLTAVTVGNPHAVIHVDHADAALARTLGPRIEQDRRFPRRTNVQFVEVLGRNRLRIEIWERGAGYTLASGSSACAAAAASVRRHLCEGRITVEMPGGVLEVEVRPDFSLTLQGPVRGVAVGRLAPDLVLGNG